MDAGEAAGALLFLLAAACGRPRHQRRRLHLHRHGRLRRVLSSLFLRGRVVERVGAGAVPRGGAGAAGGGVGVHGDVGDAGDGGHLQLRRQRQRQSPRLEARAPVQVGDPGTMSSRRRGRGTRVPTPR
uniref:Uncharacterized protein n=1 Tax=Arundo donax TaxID=35708 RepID=A0A0A9GJG0_ARUDO